MAQKLILLEQIASGKEALTDLLARLDNLDVNDLASGVLDTDLTSVSGNDDTIPSAKAVKAYVDLISYGVKWKEPVRVATTAELVTTYLNGVLTADADGSINTAGIDGVTTLEVGDRILVKNQATDPEENGIYEITALGDEDDPYVLTRTSDANEGTEFPQMAVFIKEGTVNSDQGYVLATDGAITVGTTELSYVQFTGLGQITAGEGLSKSGTDNNTLDVNVDDSTIEITDDNLNVKDAGITAAKLNSDVAGSGLVLNGSTNAIDINTGTGIGVTDDTLDVILDGSSLANGEDGLSVSAVDADVVTVSNLETDNLKSGVLDTDLSSVSGSDDTIPSAKAVKAYADGITEDSIERLMSFAAESIAPPKFDTVVLYTVVSNGETAITIPSSKTYETAKGNLMVFRNGIYQRLGGDYTETSTTQVTFSANKLKSGDEIVFVIGQASKMAYSVAFTKDGSNRLSTATYSGDVDKVVTYTYVASGAAAGKVNTITIVENGITTTKTFAYTDGEVTGITVALS